MTSKKSLAEILQNKEELARLTKEYENRNAPRTHQEPPEQLLLWPDTHRGIPTAFLRSALFGVIRRGYREDVRDMMLPAWTGYRMIYTGTRLDQSDLDVWMCLIHLAKMKGNIHTVFFNARELLRMLDRTNNSQWLIEVIERLVDAEVKIESRKFKYMGRLLDDLLREKEEDGNFSVRINPRLIKLFGHTSWQEWEIRKSLKSDLSKWLLGYISSQKATIQNTHIISIGKLLELSGSTSPINKFRFNVRLHMKELHDKGVVSKWEIDHHDNLMFIK